MKKVLLLSVAAAAIASPVLASPASASVLFTPDYTSGLSSWRSVQQPAGTNRITVQANPAPSTSAWSPKVNVMRSEVRGGDITDTGGYLAARAEVYGRVPATMSSTPAAQWPDPVGSVRYYGWSIYLPVGHKFATDTTWETLTQLKGYRGGSPPIALELKRSNFLLGGTKQGAYGSAKDLGSATPGKWTRFVIGVSLSNDASKGWVEAWRDGVQKVKRTTTATMDTYQGKPDPIYLKQGVYRSKAFTQTHVAYYGPVKVGTSYADVAS